MRFYLAGDALDYADPGPLQRRDFIGIVREQPHLLDPQRFQDLSRQAKLAMIGLEAQLLVGLHGIQTLVLQFIGLQFGHQSDPAPFLLFVNQHTAPGLGDHGKGHFKLLPAVATQRAEDVSGKALRVHAHQCECIGIVA